MRILTFLLVAGAIIAQSTTGRFGYLPQPTNTPFALFFVDRDHVGGRCHMEGPPGATLASSLSLVHYEPSGVRTMLLSDGDLVLGDRKLLVLTVGQQSQIAVGFVCFGQELYALAYDPSGKAALVHKPVGAAARLLLKPGDTLTFKRPDGATKQATLEQVPLVLFHYGRVVILAYMTVDGLPSRWLLEITPEGHVGLVDLFSINRNEVPSGSVCLTSESVYIWTTLGNDNATQQSLIRFSKNGERRTLLGKYRLVSGGLACRKTAVALFYQSPSGTENFWSQVADGSDQIQPLVTDLSGGGPVDSFAQSWFAEKEVWLLDTNRTIFRIKDGKREQVKQSTDSPAGLAGALVISGQNRFLFQTEGQAIRNYRILEPRLVSPGPFATAALKTFTLPCEDCSGGTLLIAGQRVSYTPVTGGLEFVVPGELSGAVPGSLDFLLGGVKLNFALNVSALPAPTIASFTVEPATIEVGQTAILAWSTAGAASVTITPGIGNVQATGTRQVTPAETTRYTITATNPGGQMTAAATLIVTLSVPRPVINRLNSGSRQQLAGAVPNLWVELHGNNFASTAALDETLPTTLVGVQVLVRDASEGVRRAQIRYASPSQVNILMPDFVGESVTIQVVVDTARGQRLESQQIRLARRETALGGFEYQSAQIITDALTGRVIPKIESLAASQFYALWFTGCGATTPPVPVGTPAPSDVLAQTIAQISLTFGSVPAQVTFSGLAPGYLGLCQLNFSPGADTGANWRGALQAGSDRYEF
ncbi:MAG: hypothetical protein Q8R08_04660 [bacterium]|nr:hypothetical protein [bacterium]